MSILVFKKCKSKPNFRPYMSPLPLFLSNSHHSVIISTISTLILICLVCTMELNLKGLTLGEGGMTRNLDADMAAISILDHCLIGWILTNKQIRFKYLLERLSHLWQPEKGVAIIHVDQGKYLFHFYHKIVLRRFSMEALVFYELQYHPPKDRAGWCPKSGGSRQNACLGSSAWPTLQIHAREGWQRYWSFRRWTQGVWSQKYYSQLTASLYDWGSKSMSTDHWKRDECSYSRRNLDHSQV